MAVNCRKLLVNTITALVRAYKVKGLEKLKTIYIISKILFFLPYSTFRGIFQYNT